MGGFTVSALGSTPQSLIAPVRLGADRLAINDVQSQVISWNDPYEQLTIKVAIPNYAGADVGSLRFGNGNGVVDIGANYRTSITDLAVGTVTPIVDDSVLSDTMFRLGLATAQGRVATIHISNFKTNRKVIKASVSIGSANVATNVPIHLSVEGLWSNVTDYIKSVQLVLPGAGKLGAGSQLIVYGENAL
jgi:hypothetical protein